jgi:GNAT superfamily N-acetyltransferase
MTEIEATGVREVLMEVRIAEGESEREIVGSLLVQLRSGYDLRTMVSQIKAQQERGYTVAYVEEEGQAICAAGFAIKTGLAWGKHMYIEDLVTDSERRSSGLGRVMMDWLKCHARENECEQIHLDSGVQRFPAHRFYLREGFDIASHHFSIVKLK